MKYINKYIKIFAQVVLVIIFTVFLAVLFAIFSPKMSANFLNKMICGIPLFDPWADLLSNYYSFDPANVMDIYIKNFFEVIIMGICMLVCSKITEFFRATGIIPFGKILITFFGLVIGCIFCISFGEEWGESLIAGGLIAIYGIFLVVKSILPIHNTLFNILSLKDILVIIINGFVAIILTGYITALHLYVAGDINFSVLISMAAIAMISLLILYTVDGPKK